MPEQSKGGLGATYVRGNRCIAMHKSRGGRKLRPPRLLDFLNIEFYADI